MPPPWPTTPPSATDRASYADARTRPFWLDNLPPREPRPALSETVDADLCIVGAGFTGLWAALHAKRDDPQREVVLLEERTAGFGASGRNGGFLVASLTHGLQNGLARFPEEIELLERLGRENLTGLVADVDRYRIDCDLELTGELLPILAPYQDGWLEEERELAERYGYTVEVFADAAAIQREVASPTYRGGLWTKDSGGIVDPAKLIVGLLSAALRSGVRVFEQTPARRIDAGRDAVTVRTDRGAVRARRVLLATSAYPPLLRAIRRYVLPVYDYVLVTEPLSRDQRAAIGWSHRQGIGDGANQFHYYRLTSDDRILWGGYDAVYRFGTGPGSARRPRSHVREAGTALPHHLPAARGDPVHASLGRRDRHLQPLLGVLRHRTSRPRRVRDGIHRARRRRRQIWSARGTRPARGAQHRGDPQPVRPLKAASVPARAAAHRRRAADAQSARGRRPS
jgi:glycine/D-amino acid oxidase-like deaminating enzyme